ncbi:MAG: C40 family peptidase [Lachnospiraceae bacterium]|nr:C40 family peptidase [Lachnospiraceae bacterium]
MKYEKKTQRKKQGYAILLAVLFTGILFGFYRDVTAQDKLLKTEKQNVYKGDKFDLSLCVEEEYRDLVEYKLQDEKEDKAALSDKSILHAKEEGTVLVDVIYVPEATQEPETTQEPEVTQAPEEVQDPEATQAPEEDGNTDEKHDIIETITIIIIPAEKLELSYGQTLFIPIEDYISDLQYVVSSDSESIRFFQDGTLQVIGFSPATVVAENSFGEEFTLAEITIKKPSLGSERIVRAKDSKGYDINIVDFQSISGGKEHAEWSIKDEKIAKWTNEGLKALAVGETVLTLEITAYNGETISITVPVFVTDPKISTNKVILASGCKKSITITGTIEGSIVDWDKSQTGAAYFIGIGKIYAEYKGSAKLYMTVDGREFTVTVKVSDPQYKKFSIVLYKGMSKTLKISGLVTGSKVSYSSSKKSVVTISKTGKLKGKKVGHGTITVKADGRTLKIWTEVASKKGYKASKKAIAISKTKTRYSQAQRMSKGKYDCSSLVSRVYRKYGVYFGSKKGWSPVAANIGKWCVQHHKVVAKKSVSYKKMLPGDLIFFSGWRNGRYKNITHVEMYVGEAMDVSASSRYNKVVHYGYATGDSIVLIARPTK